MTDKQLRELIEAAASVRPNAYAPFSRFEVGAAVLSTDGRIFTGVNVENSSYGLTICAERVAVGAAISTGARGLVAVAVATSGGASPCGACRQVLHEFSRQMEVVLINTDTSNSIARVSLSSLLPSAFRLE